MAPICRSKLKTFQSTGNDILQRMFLLLEIILFGYELHFEIFKIKIGLNPKIRLEIYFSPTFSTEITIFAIFADSANIIGKKIRKNASKFYLL